MNNDTLTSTPHIDFATHLVLDENNVIVDRCSSQTAAMKMQSFREKSTLRPHHIALNRI